MSYSTAVSSTTAVVARDGVNDGTGAGLQQPACPPVTPVSAPEASSDRKAARSVRQERLRRRRAIQDDQAPESERAASYSRYSSSMQRTESIADQQRECREAAERNGHVITSEREFADEAVSGTKKERTGLNSMLSAADHGQFSTLYLYSLNRLARESILTLPLLKRLVFKFKVRVISLTDGIDTNVTNWEMIASIMSCVSDQFLRDLKASVLRGQEGIVLAGHCVGDYCFGYRSEPIPGSETTRRGRNARPRKVYVICPEGSVWVERIFTWFAVENRPIAEIARELTRLGVPKDHRSTKTVWTHENVRSILENEKYVGRWSWGTMRNERDLETGRIHQELRDEEETQNWNRELPHLRLVDDELFEAAQKKLRENSGRFVKLRDGKGRLRGSRGDQRGQRLLSGLIECGGCGARFVCAGKRMFCPNHPKGACACATGLDRWLAERLILAAVGAIILESPAWLSTLETELAKASAEIRDRVPAEEQEVRRQLTDVETRRENLLRLAESGQADPDIQRRLAELRDQAHELRQRLKELESRRCVADEAPTRESLAADLQHLGERLQGAESAAGEVLRQLLGGRIVVHETTRPGSRQRYLRGTLHARVYDVSSAIGRQQGLEDAGSAPVVSRVIDLLDPERLTVEADLRDRAWQMYAEGRLVKEISAELGEHRNLIAKLLKQAAEARGEQLVDGRSRRSRLEKKHLQPPLYQAIAPQVMQLYEQGELYGTIASQLKIDINTVRESVNWWHASQGLTAPDGRERRKGLGHKDRE